MKDKILIRKVKTMHEKIIFKRIIAELITDAKENTKAFRSATDKDDKLFLSGKQLAYYEVLLTIHNRLVSADEELKDYGLDICLEKEIL
ncbi:hypothetical protein E3305_02740 [Streptococcus equinus]|uniref:hypothetical protein n=1 Tax=Streptococcus equinus TaxID=1335 RepID=UPI00106F2A6C|nr:hypothetical protein [Streptococcus equinus]TFH45140.1 hypothetical protein E3305_02740 [Streptococcus equinus]